MKRSQVYGLDYVEMRAAFLISALLAIPVAATNMIELEAE